jgi:hypothetical protein
MKKIISALVVAGAMSQMANAMGPTGDLTHRRFYKDQEWIWQTEKSHSKANGAAPGETGTQKFSGIIVWEAILASALPLASLPPLHPPLASLPPLHPPLASLPPLHPPLASLPPLHPPLASLPPLHPPSAPAS